jgi:hypothetical protein
VKTPRILLVAAAALVAARGVAVADELLPADRPIEAVIDHYIDARLKAENIPTAGPADDATIIRRLTLDLVGRIPTVAETKAYVASTDPDKRVKLVDRLIASPAYARHQAAEYDVMMMEGTDKGSIRGYLQNAFAENKPWNAIFRDVMVADESDPKQKGAGEFLRTRIKDVDKLTSEVSVVFFGVNISCAKCHDHPKVQDWKQDHFYGMKAFFNRTFDNGGFLAEREYGNVKYKTTKGVEKPAKMMFLTGKVIDAPGKEPSKDDEKKEKAMLEEFKKKKQAPPKPSFSARQQLVETALQPGQRDFFARAIANRVWHRLLGHGLVMPLDQMHSANPPSHPELLDWMARDVIDHGYDLRRLTRGLVLSKAYARTSKWTASEDAPSPRFFAVARTRALTPMQMAMSLRMATTDPLSLPETLKPEELEKKLEGLEQSARGFASQIEQPGEDFQIGAGEALLFSNNQRVMAEFLSENTDRLVGRMKQTKEPKEAIEFAVRSTLCRPPTDEEYKVMGEYLQRRADRAVPAYQQLVWALITNSEFRFNY